MIDHTQVCLDTMRNLQASIRTINAINGWSAPDDAYGCAAHHDVVRLALVSTEVAEAIEAVRHHNPLSEHIPGVSALEEELADIVIRVLDLAEFRGYDLGKAIAAKLEYNKGRGYRHGGKAV